jgi:hypothetical protein
MSDNSQGAGLTSQLFLEQFRQQERRGIVAARKQQQEQKILDSIDRTAIAAEAGAIQIEETKELLETQFKEFKDQKVKDDKIQFRINFIGILIAIAGLVVSIYAVLK